MEREFKGGRRGEEGRDASYVQQKPLNMREICGLMYLRKVALAENLYSLLTRETISVTW